MAVRIKGWTRTFLLGLGGFLGVIGTACIIHQLKKRGYVTE